MVSQLILFRKLQCPLRELLLGNATDLMHGGTTPFFSKMM